jgi:LPS O-antigen subunit length determinant protein (WzzB/FepE family)
MGNWEPILWIIGTGIAFFLVLMALEFLKRQKRRVSGVFAAPFALGFSRVVGATHID